MAAILLILCKNSKTLKSLWYTMIWLCDNKYWEFITELPVDCPLNVWVNDKIDEKFMVDSLYRVMLKVVRSCLNPQTYTIRISVNMQQVINLNVKRRAFARVWYKKFMWNWSFFSHEKFVLDLTYSYMFKYNLGKGQFPSILYKYICLSFLTSPFLKKRFFE